MTAALGCRRAVRALALAALVCGMAQAQETAPSRTERATAPDLDALVRAAAQTYRPGPVLSGGPEDPILSRGPFVLRKRPVAAEHKFPWDYGKPWYELNRLRYYPFLAWDLYLDHGDCLQLLATNYLFNSAFPPKGSDCVRVPSGGGLGYIEAVDPDGATHKHLVLRLRDKTVKLTRIDDASGMCDLAVYSISGYGAARFAHEYVRTEEPLRLTITAAELASAREGEHLRRLLEGAEDQVYTGYWTLPEKRRVRDWVGMSTPRDLRVVDVSGEGSATALPIDVGQFDLLFEQALTYTGRGYDRSPGAGYSFRMFYPEQKGD